MTPQFVSATPLVHITSARQAVDFYCKQLGFRVESEYRPSGPGTEPAYLVFVRDGVRLDASSFRDDGVAGHVIGFGVRDVDALHAEFTARGVTIDLTPTNQTWGNREMYLRDPDGNKLRFGQPVSQGDS